ncbi:MAG: hypothetical protein HOP07_15225 [Bacteriovoracaceae bacterium]|nr:hypothetical protein [Bacteriovoracaceae bacterium]
MDIVNDLLKSGVHGLDQVLGGGFLPARLYLIVGAAGTGKTIHGNQIAFYNIKKGQMSLFVTLSSESQGRMLDHIRPFNFYTDESIGQGLRI